MKTLINRLFSASSKMGASETVMIKCYIYIYNTHKFFIFVLVDGTTLLLSLSSIFFSSEPKKFLAFFWEPYQVSITTVGVSTGLSVYCDPSFFFPLLNFFK